MGEARETRYKNPTTDRAQPIKHRQHPGQFRHKAIKQSRIAARFGCGGIE